MDREIEELVGDLDLPVATPIRTRGRAAKPVSATIVRELTAEDVASRQCELGTSAPTLQRLTQRHHSLARSLAEGVPQGQAAVATGYCASRVSILKSDPAFRELVEFYRTHKDGRYFDFHEQLAALGIEATNEVMKRLEDAPEELSVGQLKELITLAADRTGHGPQTSNTQLNVNIGLADRVAAARKRASEVSRVIEHDDQEIANG